MFLVNGMKATLRQFNRDENNEIFDDTNYKEITIKCCPFYCESAIRFGIYTVPEATGYYQVGRLVDVKVGDQIIYLGKYADNKRNQFCHLFPVYGAYHCNNKCCQTAKNG